MLGDMLQLLRSDSRLDVGSVRRFVARLTVLRQTSGCRRVEHLLPEIGNGDAAIGPQGAARLFPNGAITFLLRLRFRETRTRPGHGPVLRLWAPLDVDAPFRFPEFLAAIANPEVDFRPLVLRSRHVNASGLQ